MTLRHSLHWWSERRTALDQQFFRSGEFARMTSVLVRTLRYYDKVGLLSPSKRTEAGYRLYTGADLVRLQQILCLKFLGLTLEEIRIFLAAPALGFREALAQQRAMMRERRAQVDTVIRVIDEAERLLGVDQDNLWDSLVRVIRAIQMEQKSDWRRKYFTEQQLETMEELSQKSYLERARQAMAFRGE